MRFSRHLLVAALFAALVAGSGYAAEGFRELAAERLTREVVDALATEPFEGRRTGTRGGELARDYLLAKLRTVLAEAGLPDAPVATQQFDVTRGIRVAGEPQVELGGVSLAQDEDFVVAPFSGGGTAQEAPLVFAGYGIVAAELGWDDYAGVEPDGAVPIIVRGEPTPGEQPSVYSDLRRKASYARDRGAAALLVVADPRGDEAEELPESRPTYSAANFDIPVLHIRASTAEVLLQQSGGRSLTEVLEQIERDSTPQSFTLADTRASLNVQVERDLVSGWNVYAIIPGLDPELSAEYVVIGAHYDHLGIGGAESLAPGEFGTVHPGADDNASGVAAVVALAQRVALNPQRGRSTLVVLFDAEEIGVVGSSRFVEDCPIPLARTVAMLNFDMVGRLRDRRLIIGGAGTAEEFESLLAEVSAGHELTLERDASGFGASDHMGFVARDIPVLFFFTGVHEDYHRPSDTADKINHGGIAAVVAFAGDVVEHLLSRNEPLTFVSVAPPPPTRSRGGLTVTLGTVPAYIESDVEGMGIGDVVPDGPAQRAGLRGGDVIVRIGDKRIANIHDFMFALEGRSPGEVVEVAVVRDGEEISFEVTLAARNVQP